MDESLDEASNERSTEDARPARRRTNLLVYSCSGCSSAAQLANALAVRLDREYLAEMSCIVGVAAGVPSLVRKAQSQRRILAIDGCPIHCCKLALANCGVVADKHLDLSTAGIHKRRHEDATPAEAERAWNHLVRPAAIALLEATDQKPETKSDADATGEKMK